MSIMPIAATDNRSQTNAAHATRLLEFLYQQGNDGHSIPLDKAGQCLLDSLGCGLLGATQPWGRIVTEEAQSDNSQGFSSILGQAGKVAPSQAALCNGTAMHGFELDDLLPAALIHPGAVIVPAAFAAAEAVDASGLSLLRGIAVGYEATSRISRALGTNPSNLGFHKTSIVGPVAGAIAAGVAMGLDYKQLQWAVGLACSCASGIKSFAAGGGGMVKRLHAGRAAEAGVRMAMLARRGFTAPLNAIDGKFGLLDVFGGSTAHPELLDEDLGSNWAVGDVWVKVYPICGWIQGVVQVLSAVRSQENFDLASVARITVATSSFAVKYNGNTNPEDTMDAQYSIPYCVAVALAGDPMDPSEYAPERLLDPQRRSTIDKVELKVDPSADSVYPKQFACKVTLEFIDGRTETAQTFDAHGTPGDPCTPQELVEKFSRLAELSGLNLDASAIVSCVNSLASGSSVRELASRLIPRP